MAGKDSQGSHSHPISILSELPGMGLTTSSPLRTNPFLSWRLATILSPSHLRQLTLPFLLFYSPCSRTLPRLTPHSDILAPRCHPALLPDSTWPFLVLFHLSPPFIQTSHSSRQDIVLQQRLKMPGLCGTQATDHTSEAEQDIQRSTRPSPCPRTQWIFQGY